MINLILYIILNLTSQVLVKKATLKNTSKKNLSFLFGMYTDYRVIIGYSLTFSSLFVWVFALRVVNLSDATIIVSFNYVLIIFSDYFFNEEIKARNLIGAFLISFGIIIDVL